MASAKAKGIGLVGLAVLVLVLWLIFHEDTSYAADLAAGLASGKQVPIPEFGTDNIIDAADAVAETGSLPLPKLTISPSMKAQNSSF